MPVNHWRGAKKAFLAVFFVALAHVAHGQAGDDPGSILDSIADGLNKLGERAEEFARFGGVKEKAVRFPARYQQFGRP